MVQAKMRDRDRYREESWRKTDGETKLKKASRTLETKFRDLQTQALLWTWEGVLSLRQKMIQKGYNLVCGWAGEVSQKTL